MYGRIPHGIHESINIDATYLEPTRLDFDREEEEEKSASSSYRQESERESLSSEKSPRTDVYIYIAGIIIRGSGIKCVERSKRGCPPAN